MTNGKNTKKKGAPMLVLVYVGVVLFMAVMSEFGPEAVVPIITMLVFVGAIAAVAVAAKKKNTSYTHTHDRIDHRQDTRINPTTGAREAAPIRTAPHSPREHWKMQLDALLENGTIDRSEYRAMMNRKF